MRSPPPPLARSSDARTFDVICAGATSWHVVAEGETRLGLRPGGGAAEASLALARRGLRVGLVAALGDDTFGRALCERVAAAGVDVGGVTFATPHLGLVFIERAGSGGEIVAYREEEQPVAIPAGWSSQVLLLSGLSPAVAHGAAFCKAARAARRAGTVVILDIDAKHHVWAGRDPRAIRSVLREADVVRCSPVDFVVLQTDFGEMRRAMRSDAVLVGDDPLGHVSASGPFGEIRRETRARSNASPAGSDALTASLCAELARAGQGRGSAALWERAIRDGGAARPPVRR